MAFEIAVSPMVVTREIDASFVSRGAPNIVGTVLGLSKKGAAFVPTRCEGYSDYATRFGGLNPDLYAGYAVKSYLRNSDSVYMVRVLGKDDVSLGKAVQIAFPASGITSSVTSTGPSASTSNYVFANLRSRNAVPGFFSYTGNYSSCTLYDGVNTATVSFDSTSENYIKKVLGVDPTTVYTGDSLTGWYVDSVFDYATSLTAGWGTITGSLTSTTAVEQVNYRAIADGYDHAKSPVFVSQNFGGSVYPLFRMHSLSDGNESNYDFKISITNVQTISTSGTPLDYPKFDVIIRAFDDTDRRPLVYETFSQVCLDPSANNFLPKAIGNKYQTVDLTQSPPEVIDNGEFDNKSKYVRVEMFEGYPKTARPSGFQGIPKGASPKVIPAMPYKTNHLDSNSDVSTNVFMGIDFTKSGIKARLKPTVTNINAGGPYTAAADAGMLLFSTTSELSGSASLASSYQAVDISATGSTYEQKIRFSVPLYGGWNGYSTEFKEKSLQANGSLTSSYLDAIRIMSNTRQFDTNLIVTPGINSATPGNICSKILEVVENRGDCFYIIDPAPSSAVDSGLSATITEVVSSASDFDSSYAAMYYPWLLTKDDENNKDVWVPPSVEVFGALAYNDRVGQIWSAPAGFGRAALSNVKSARKRITTANSDALYTGKINPIVSFSNDGVVIYGQKTLQNADSALNRVAIRRLLLELRKVIATLGNFYEFEPNDPTTRQSFVGVIKPYLERVRQLRGLVDFRIVIDETTTTPVEEEKGILYGKIFVKPTRTVEFIQLDFVITRQGASFSE